MYLYKSCFSLINQKGKWLTEPRVAVRICAKLEFLGVNSVQALRRSKWLLPSWREASHSFVTEFSLSIVGVNNDEGITGDNGVKVIKIVREKRV